MTIEWKDSFKLGENKLDAQHQHLFELAKKMQDTDELPQIRALAEQLYKHTRIHFDDEERLMRQHNYPGRAAHVQAHDRLLDRLTLLSQGIGQGQIDRAGLNTLMNDWALFHIPQDDARLEAFLKPGA